MMTAVGSTGKVNILSMLLWVRKVRPTPTVLNASYQRLNTQKRLNIPIEEWK